MPISVLHLSFSRSGGAGNVARILTEARNSQGHPTAHAFAIKKSLWADPLSSPRHTAAAAADHFIIKSSGFGSPISVLRNSLDYHLGKEWGDPDVLHLHSINGLLNLNQLATDWSSKRIVWTLHDMNPMTGACHYSLGCKRYLSGCQSCPAVRTPFHNQVSQALEAKASALARLERLQLVAPSDWLAQVASESKALAKFPLTVIPNPLDPLFCEKPSTGSRTRDLTFVIIAQNLADRVKNVAMAVEAFRRLRRLHPRITLALVGNNGKNFHSEGILNLGVLSRRQIAETLERAGTLLVPSLAENSPLVIGEAAAHGVSSLVNHVGGMPDMVKDLGYGSSFHGEQDLFEKMTSLVTKKVSKIPNSRRGIAERALSLYSASRISAQYNEVYSF